MLELISEKKQSLKEFTENNYAQASFFWNALLKGKEIKVNGVRVNKDIQLDAGDVVQYYLTPKQAAKEAYFIRYSDENITVVDKASGVNSEAVYAALARTGEYYFIHRLDRNTCGLLLFARNPKTEQALLLAFREKRVEKIYHALCFGVPPKSAEVLTAYLKKDADKALARVTDKPVSGSEPIVTEYRVIERMEECTKLEITLHTGKTHQIRAHLAHIGCPIVGDMKYGDNAKNKARNATRQRLVAKLLRLHVTGELSYLNEKEWQSCFEIEN